MRVYEIMKNKLEIPKPKKVKKCTLLRKADKLFSIIVRSRGVCELKGLDSVRCGGVLQTMHIVGRANRRLRWDFKNVICGCSGHHVYYTFHPEDFRELMALHFPEHIEYIVDHRNKIMQESYEDVIKRLAELL